MIIEALKRYAKYHLDSDDPYARMFGEDLSVRLRYVHDLASIEEYIHYSEVMDALKMFGDIIHKES